MHYGGTASACATCHDYERPEGRSVAEARPSPLRCRDVSGVAREWATRANGHYIRCYASLLPWFTRRCRHYSICGLKGEFAATTIRALNFQGFKDSPDMEAVSNFQGKLWVTPKCIAMRKKWCPANGVPGVGLRSIRSKVTFSAHRSSMGVRLSGKVIARR